MVALRHCSCGLGRGGALVDIVQGNLTGPYDVLFSNGVSRFHNNSLLQVIREEKLVSL